MALEFKKQLEAISFGDLVATPKVDMEKRLRLQNIKLDKADAVREAINVMAECFGENAEAVKSFIDENMSVVELAQLQVYLVGGQDMLDSVNKKLKGAE